jgi:hypothetical protein
MLAGFVELLRLGELGKFESELHISPPSPSHAASRSSRRSRSRGTPADQMGRTVFLRRLSDTFDEARPIAGMATNSTDSFYAPITQNSKLKIRIAGFCHNRSRVEYRRDPFSVRAA